MRTACSLVPPRFEDGRHDAILSGLKAAGLSIIDAPERADVLVTWNRHAPTVHEAATACEARGGRVIVCEEGYTRRLVEQKYFAMALHGHNGSGQWFPGGPERFEALGIELQPWQESGGSILVCASRGMGAPEMREPKGWADKVAGEIRRHTRRPVVIRRHPGKQYAEQPFEEALKEPPWAVVVWGSACAVAALAAGVPVFIAGPRHIVMEAALRKLRKIDWPLVGRRRDGRDIRLAPFEDMAWAQWMLEEIAAGQPFNHLLR